MSFKEVKLGWNGTEYVIEPDRVLGAIARIEDIVTLEELSRFGAKQSLPRAKLAMAFGAVLRYAGAKKLTDDDVYHGMFGDERSSANMMAAVTALMAMMVPAGSEGGAAETNPPLTP